MKKGNVILDVNPKRKQDQVVLEETSAKLKKGTFNGRDSFLEEEKSKPKWIVIRKLGQERGGEKIELPKTLQELLDTGGPSWDSNRDSKQSKSESMEHLQMYQRWRPFKMEKLFI
jgi:hypothetical protein